MFVVSTKVNRYKRQPHDTSGIHREANILGLIVIRRDLARFKCVKRAQQNQDDVEQQRHHQGKRRYAAFEHRRHRIWIYFRDVWWFEYQPRHAPDKLDGNNPCANERQIV